MNKKTKIVCTMGPSTDSLEMVESLLRAGMNVARFNFSHGSHEGQAKRMELVRLASTRTGIPVALMLDTKGPEIRLGLFKDGKVCLEEGQAFTLTTRDVEGTKEICSVNHAGLPEDVKEAKQILLSDGLVTLRIDSIEGTEIHTTVMNTGMMSNRKRVAVSGVSLSLPPVSEQDEKDLVFGCEMVVDYVAASFMQRASDVVAIRRILESKGADIRIISKIENRLDEIEESDFYKSGSNIMDEVFELRGDLLKLRRGLRPMREVIHRFLVSRRVEMTDNDRKYFHDIYDDLVQQTEVIEANRELASDIRENFMTYNSLKSNNIMMTLTVISTIFLPLTFIVGLYGMNFKNMPELEWQYGYFLICAIMLLIAIGMLWVFKKKGWLDMFK